MPSSKPACPSLFAPPQPPEITKHRLKPFLNKPQPHIQTLEQLFLVSPQSHKVLRQLALKQDFEKPIQVVDLRRDPLQKGCIVPQLLLFFLCPWYCLDAI
ncbi:aspartate--tRNA ligase [Striga asiatica]|uniref:Aspartate--tRNA ligase n=1 Tax=Striga asiatica TaxID=4170 RepID=A0A5A7Q6S0_STRAF|nr:aspartate--tRNA ligase [Striga asiatica]